MRAGTERRTSAVNQPAHVFLSNTEKPVILWCKISEEERGSPHADGHIGTGIAPLRYFRRLASIATFMNDLLNRFPWLCLMVIDHEMAFEEKQFYYTTTGKTLRTLPRSSFLSELIPHDSFTILIARHAGQCTRMKTLPKSIVF